MKISFLYNAKPYHIPAVHPAAGAGAGALCRNGPADAVLDRVGYLAAVYRQRALGSAKCRLRHPGTLGQRGAGRPVAQPLCGAPRNQPAVHIPRRRPAAAHASPASEGLAAHVTAPRPPDSP